MSAVFNDSRAGDFATARKGGITQHELDFARTKVAAGVPLSAIARMIGRPVTDLGDVQAERPPMRPAPTPTPPPLVKVAVVPLNHPDPTPDTFLSIWKGVIPRPDPRPTLKAIANMVATYYGVTVEDIRGPSRAALNVIPRQAFCWVAYETKRYSLPQIGAFLSRDHTTVLAAIRRHAKRLAEAEARPEAA